MPILDAIHIIIRSGVILGCLILGTVYSLAQTGSITGRITDNFGLMIPGAKIKAVRSSTDRTATPQTFRVVSNYNGAFTIPSLPFGSYEVEVEAQVLTTLKEKVIVMGKKPARYDLQITPPKVFGCAKRSNIALAEKDKAEIINQVLTMEIPRWRSVEQQTLLSNQNIKAAWVNAPLGHKVTVLSTDEIINKARPGEFLNYCYFSKFKVHGDCVEITIYQHIITSGGGHGLGGSVDTYVFRKEAGVWKGRVFNGYIS